MSNHLRVFILSISFGLVFWGLPAQTQEVEAQDLPLGVEEEFDPFAPGAQQALEEFDEVYRQRTGVSPFVENLLIRASYCQRESCEVWIYVSKSDQTLYLYIDGRFEQSWLVSTGVAGRRTPDLDRHPNGRIYDRYNSVKFPGGDYRGLGNMPYAIFIAGGIALHGTPSSNWKYLGRPASHGCIRQHPDNAKYLNRLVRSVGVQNVWVTID